MRAATTTTAMRAPAPTCATATSTSTVRASTAAHAATTAGAMRAASATIAAGRTSTRRSTAGVRMAARRRGAAGRSGPGRIDRMRVSWRIDRMPLAKAALPRRPLWRPGWSLEDRRRPVIQETRRGMPNRLLVRRQRAQWLHHVPSHHNRGFPTSDRQPAKPARGDGG